MLAFGRMNEKGLSMGFRRRTRRRALVAGAAIAHHRSNMYADEEAYDEAPADDYLEPAPYAPPPPNSADEIEHLAQLHASGVLTDEEFAAAKAKALGS